MLGFGAAALLLAGVGMFGGIAYVVSKRIGELAVRQAADAHDLGERITRWVRRRTPTRGWWRSCRAGGPERRTYG